MEEMEEQVTLPYHTFKGLVIDSAKLAQLESNGVDNWTEYGCCCNWTGDSECIFCTEDEEKFLGLKIV